MPPRTNPRCLHNADYACTSCGKCADCCACIMVGGQLPELQHADSKIIQERWRVLRVVDADKEARRAG